MDVVINGKPRAVSDGISVKDLVSGLGLSTTSVIVELNEQVVKRELYPETTLREGDRIEVIQMVGGG